MLSKNTIMEYTNRIGFLTGTYVRIASPKYYITDLTKRLNIREKIIDVKKEYTYEKGQRSKVLVIYATEEKADQINEKLSTIKSKRYRYVSYKKTTSEERLASMHFNDMKNIKAQYESMFNTLLNERIIVESRQQVTLESHLISLTEGGQQLFIAAEQGVGKYENNVTVILNPKMIKKAKQWLANKYQKLNFEETKERKLSVNEEQYKVNSEYNDELREFLKPTLESKEVAKNKKYGKSMKTYAQALGIKQYNNQKENVEQKTPNNSKKYLQREMVDSNTKEIILALQD